MSRCNVHWRHKLILMKLTLRSSPFQSDPSPSKYEASTKHGCHLLVHRHHHTIPKTGPIGWLMDFSYTSTLGSTSGTFQTRVKKLLHGTHIGSSHHAIVHQQPLWHISWEPYLEIESPPRTHLWSPLQLRHDRHYLQGRGARPNIMCSF
jgi:hypothetical protein